jgi:hypothetical protein
MLITHIISPCLTNSNSYLNFRQNLMYDSLYNFKKDNVKQVLYVLKTERDALPNDYSYHFDERFNYFLSEIDTSYLNETYKPKPILSHVMKTCYDVSDGDCEWLIYSNSDVSINKNFYDTIEENKNYDALLLHKNIVLGSPKSYKDLVGNNYPSESEICGIDGIAIKKKKYYEGLFPDLVLGEPAWDIITGGLLEDKMTTCDIFNILYEPHHKRTWEWDWNDMSIHNNFIMVMKPQLKIYYKNRMMRWNWDIKKQKEHLEDLIDENYK